eukprot:TRINITY_DN10251_c0_g1_i1.p1 TRINITY_DN10251_c0_g1~~TRINITY_DN10251_c0_g1_i1.p1  ORF type:complete len:346 (+),score=25.12 TRINITY_DN10251_c0_g1_i1:116-1153(+)
MRRSVFTFATSIVIFGLFFSHAVVAAPTVYTVSPRPIKGQAGQISVVISTIDSDGKITDLGSVIPSVDTGDYKAMIRSSGLCPRGLVYNYATNLVSKNQASVYFFSITRKTSRQVVVPSTWASNKQPLGGIYFDAENLYGMYGNVLVYFDPANGTVINTVQLWPSNFDCKASPRLSYDLINKKLMAHCATTSNTGSVCDYLIVIDPVTGAVNFPKTCLQGQNAPEVSFFAALDAQTAVTISQTDSGPEAILANLVNSTWGPIKVTSDTFSNAPAEWMRPDTTVWDVKTGLMWFMGRGPVIGRQFRIMSADLSTGALSEPAPTSVTFPYENWQYILPFTSLLKPFE